MSVGSDWPRFSTTFYIEFGPVNLLEGNPKPTCCHQIVVLELIHTVIIADASTQD